MAKTQRQLNFQRNDYADVMRRRTAKLAEAELETERRVLTFIDVRNAELRETWRRKMVARG